MYKKLFSAALALLWGAGTLQSQSLRTIGNPEVIQGTLIRITPPLSDIKLDPNAINEIVRDENGVIVQKEEDTEHRLGGHPVVDPLALPMGDDPVRQWSLPAKKRTSSVGANIAGMGYTNVNPADPSLCVGPNHVIQMINGSSGAYIKIFDKSGNQVQAQTYMDAITGIGGLGDPVAVYDQFANRFVLTEFAAAGNALIVMVSQTASPTGSWYVYSFTTPQFPDYPKWGVWPNAYICTSNESNNKVYAFNRATMLAGGASPTMLSFSIAGSPTIGFQAAAPVNISGTNLPPAGTAPMILRMVDDAWTAAADVDRLELWYLNADFITPANSTLVQQPDIATAPFTSDLCGYTTLNCIRQPGTNTRMDPIREIIMNRVWYRNFNTHQSLVAVHAVDPGTLDQAGSRWYELRRTGLGSWSIYQQSTFAPDTNSRWMPTIGINGEGSIALAYNVSSKVVYPSMRITGRNSAAALGQMTEPEQVLVNGSGFNNSNRWGDYNDMQVDPADDVTFWVTGMYKPAAAGWATQVNSFSISNTVLPLQLLAFEGERNTHGAVNLQWTVQHEQQVSRYEIERSTDGGPFVSIGEVAYRESAQTKQEYGFSDSKANANAEYAYRLKMIDEDGKFRYSHTVIITAEGMTQPLVYPNPVNGNELFVRLPEQYAAQSLNFSVIGTNGQTVSQSNKDGSDAQLIRRIALNGITAGVYQLQVKDRHGKMLLQERVLKLSQE